MAKAKQQQAMSEHSELPWRAEVGERLSDGSDCWVIDSEENSICEMMCPADVEEANAKLIVRAVNSHEKLVGELRFAVLNGHKWTKEDWRNWIVNHAKQALLFVESQQ